MRASRSGRQLQFQAKTTPSKWNPSAHFYTQFTTTFSCPASSCRRNLDCHAPHPHCHAHKTPRGTQSDFKGPVITHSNPPSMISALNHHAGETLTTMLRTPIVTRTRRLEQLNFEGLGHEGQVFSLC